LIEMIKINFLKRLSLRLYSWNTDSYRLSHFDRDTVLGAVQTLKNLKPKSVPVSVHILTIA